MFWRVNENCDVDVAIERSGYQSKTNSRERKLLFRFSFFFALG